MFDQAAALLNWECVHNIATSRGLVFSLFLAGLVGGATHCAGMCGPFVLAQSGAVRKLSSTLLLPYHFGRMTTYVTLAVLLSSILNLAFLFLPVRTLVVAPILVLAGALFLVSAFPGLTNLFPWISRINLSVPYRWMSGTVEQISGESDAVIKRYMLGVMLGFMPCGLVLAALMAAATAETPVQAGLAMGAFTIGTMPALFLVAGGGRILKIHHPALFSKVQKCLMIFSGLWLFALAGFMVF